MARVTLMGSVVLCSAAVIVVCLLTLSGCGLQRPTPHSIQLTESAEPELADESAQSAGLHKEPEPPMIVRVGGYTATQATFVSGEYRWGESRIDTPLPEGYPAPTPPGAIDIKRYPLVRRAGVSGKMWPDWGMNIAFFPLFNHISRRQIAMTSPVEMNYDGMARSESGSPRSWTMSFLYRTPDQGPDGVDPEDERILIEDIPPVTVISIGMRGAYSLENVRTGVASLRSWLAFQSEWQESGDPRAMFYNDPSVKTQDLWLEVQLPVVRKENRDE